MNINGSAGNPAILHLQNSLALGTTSTVTAVNRNSGVRLQGNITLPNTVTFFMSNDATSGTVPYAINNVSDNNTINGQINLTTGGGSTLVQSDSGSLTLAGNVTIAAGQTSRGIVLQGASTGANTVSGAISDLSGASVASVTKNGTGIWTLTGLNTYSGMTMVNAGTLNITGNSSGSSSAVTVKADATLGGNGEIGGSVTIEASGIHSLAVAATDGAQDIRTLGGALTNATGSILHLTAAVTPAPGVYTLVNASSISGLPTTVTGYTGGVVSISGNSLILTVPSASAYDAWALAKGLTGANNGPEQDNGDFDGIPNVLEYVLDGNPLAPDNGKLPKPSEDATNFYFDFDRRDDSVSEVALTFEYGDTLQTWPSNVAIPANNTPVAGPPVTITDNGGGTHHVKVTVAKAANSKLFGRLNAVK
jgi:autotransporter-associated beta strand protein